MANGTGSGLPTATGTAATAADSAVAAGAAATSSGATSGITKRPRVAFAWFVCAETIKLNQLVRKPETFNGVRPNPRRWIDDYEDAMIANGWSDGVAVKYFSTFLSGDALDWYKTSVRTQLEATTVF